MVIGGGPSGAVVARLLVSLGHRVRLLTRRHDPARTLANSLPPSTHKLLAQVGILDAIDRIGYRTSGNTVWWGDREGHAEPFSADGSAWGYQVDRALLDPLLLDSAADAGVAIDPDARVSRVDLRHESQIVSYESGGIAATCAARFVLDCSGRSGAIAVPLRLRRHVRGGRMQALVGVWERDAEWFLQNWSHTFIETCREGWAWSLPTTDRARHVGIMVDGATSRLTRGATLEATYRAQLALTARIDGQVRNARLVRVFACDSSVYSARHHAGPGFALVGDAGSTLNPLSSFGIKKALASAWLAAIVANTCLRHPDRADAAHTFFSQWEQQVWRVNLRRSREFAAEALSRHRSPFWAMQASTAAADMSSPLGEAELLSQTSVARALQRLRETDTVVFLRNADRTLVSAPLIRGDEIAIEDAIALGSDAYPLRYARGIDLVSLLAMAPQCPDVGRIYERYCSTHGPATLPDFLAALSLLVARDVLRLDATRACPASTSLSE